MLIVNFKKTVSMSSVIKKKKKRKKPKTQGKCSIQDSAKTLRSHKRIAIQYYHKP